MTQHENISETNLLSEAKRRLLEKCLREQVNQRQKASAPITRRPADVPVPLSFSQEQVWVHCHLAGEIPIYNEPVTITRRGPLDPFVLEQCLKEIVRRHEVWRTTFDMFKGQPVQVIHPAPASFPLSIVDLRNRDESQREEEALRVATMEVEKPFDLKQGPLLRAALVTLAEDHHRLYVTFHQIIFDAVSAYRVFLPELVALYEDFSAGKPSSLPEASVQFGDYAYWQRNLVPQDALAKHLGYWREKFAGEIPILPWPNDHPRRTVQSHRGAIHTFGLPSALARSLRNFCQREGASPYMALVAAYAAVLYHYTAQEEIILGSLSAGRKRPELQTVAGFFVNPFPLRIVLTGDASFKELLSQVREQVLDGLAHDEIPFEHVVRGLGVRPDPSRNPLFQTILSFQPQLPTRYPGWSLTTEEVSNGGSKLDLMIVFEDLGDILSGRVIFNPDLFETTTISRLLGHCQVLLNAALVEPDRRLSELPILAGADRRRLLIDWNDNQREYPAVCAHELLEAQTRQTPDKVAVIFEDRKLTYRDLDERANQLAGFLSRLGVGPDVLVGICIDRSPELLTGLLGVWKAGGAYVPLDPEYPAERLAFLIRDSGLKFLVTQEKYRARFIDLGIRTICLDSDASQLSRESKSAPRTGVAPANLAYVIYTSGSTGTPKAVQIEHRSVVNFLVSMQATPGLNSQDVLLAITTISFDIAGLEIYLPLSVGARIVLANRDTARDGERLQQLMAETDPTCTQATPATWRMLINSGWSGNKNLKVLCGGEAMTADLACKLLERSACVWNLYGPTETTIWSIIHQVTSGEQSPPIGRPIPNTEIYVLDAHLQPVPEGVVGELYIGGAGLARGYLNRPELTAESFLPQPFPREGSSARVYKTGDTVRYRSGGALEYCGRRDDQVKVRGYRIEPNEIITALNQHAAILASTVSLREGADSEKRLVAYVVPRPGAPLREADLREHLGTRLPKYMIPAAFVRMDSLTLNSNDKVDRAALPIPDSHNTLRDEISITASSPIEKRVGETLAALLEVDRVGTDANFFDLGGHSLLGTQFIARLRDSFAVELTVRNLFETPTVAGISATIEQLLLKDQPGTEETLRLART